MSPTLGQRRSLAGRRITLSECLAWCTMDRAASLRRPPHNVFLCFGARCTII
jgi:hypothetical protein